MKYLPLLVLLFASCVMPSDIEDLRRVQSTFETAVREDLDQYQRGLITREQFDAEVEKAEAEREAEVTAIEQKIEDRTEAALTVVPITGNPALDAFLQFGTAALGVGYGVNRYRDKKREKRGEAV